MILAVGVTTQPTGFRRFLNWLTWQRIPVSQIPLREPKRELAVLLAYACFYVALGYATGLLIKAHPLPLMGASYFTQDAWYVFLFKIGGLLILPLIIFYRWGYRARDLLLDWRWAPRTITITVLAFLFGVVVNANRFVEIGGASVQFARGDYWLRVGVGMMMVLFTAGLPEEIFFRGLLQTRLEVLAGRFPAIVVSNLIFMAWHLPSRYLLATGPAGKVGDFISVLLGTGLPVFVVGVIFGWLWDRYRRLIPLMALHWGGDVLPSASSMLRLPF